MAIYPHTTLKRGPAANEWTVLFHGHTIGTVQKFVYEGRGISGKPKQIVRWYIHTTDAVDHHGWGRRTRELAIVGLVRLYTDYTGSSSALHNIWVERVRNRVESCDASEGGAS